MHEKPKTPKGHSALVLENADAAVSLSAEKCKNTESLTIVGAKPRGDGDKVVKMEWVESLSKDLSGKQLRNKIKGRTRP